MLRRTAGLLASLTLIVSVAACSSGSSSKSDSGGAASGGAVDTSKPIKVGAVAPLTGASATPGNFQLDGLKAAVAYVNDNGGILGRKVELTSEDSGGNPVQSVAKLKQLVGQKIDVVFGDLLAGYSAMVPEFTKSNIISISQNTTDSLWDTASANPNGFNVFIPTRGYATLYVDYLVDNFHVKKIGVIGSTDTFAASLFTAVKDYAKTKGVEVVTQQYDPNATDISSQMRALKNAGADGLISATFAAGQVLSINAEQAVGWDPPAVTSNTLNSSAGVAAVKAAGLKHLVGGPVAKFMLSAPGAAETTQQKTFLDYLAKQVPSGQSLDGVWSSGLTWFDGLLVWKAAVEKAGSTDTAAVKKVLESGTPLAGWSGDFTFSSTSHVTADVTSIFGLYAGGVSCPRACAAAPTS
jgi:branched-chain amino acid transport system substrate-binding protein